MHQHQHKHSPQERQARFLTVVVFIVGTLLIVGLLWLINGNQLRVH